jgi:hypothetical protein
LSVWRSYLQDMRDGRTDPTDYIQEVKQRVILSRLLEQTRSSPDVNTTTSVLDGLDRDLRSMFVYGEFVWDARLKRVYPEEDFWFLYGELRT